MYSVAELLFSTHKDQGLIPRTGGKKVRSYCINRYQIRTIYFICTIEYYSAIKGSSDTHYNINFGDSQLNDISQTQKDKWCAISVV